MSRQVVVWRHGRTAWNVAGRVQGQTDVPLDEVGREQAESAARRLAVLRPHRIVCSDLQRARDTAEALGRVSGVPVEPDQRFREMNFGAREGFTWEESFERFPEGMRAWVRGDETKIPDAETHAQAGERFASGVKELLWELPPKETLVIVAHGAVIRTGVCAFLGIPQQNWRTFGALSNCSWSVLTEYGPSRHRFWRLTEWNAGTLPEPVMTDDA
ncbi:MAG: histidine phosphatase family protein [Aeromicrobium sp.]|uniref:histidine phosphatase family protein n=1 Tax=Aeromicrobium sp. TaxID=1871063 RepID=UPI0039E723B7